ncbi:hypothetical protein CRI93_12155 [Longimonas halophila]|uniref:Uncharacterized protein n=1 Tax=Longimonas halophila TaxID=1469170 RepID=A0A2H3NV81_9BACT|nr:hypothetical protein CRI93_12155 [Longimonas halophila]
MRHEAEPRDEVAMVYICNKRRITQSVVTTKRIHQTGEPVGDWWGCDEWVFGRGVLAVRWDWWGRRGA